MSASLSHLTKIGLDERDGTCGKPMERARSQEDDQLAPGLFYDPLSRDRSHVEEIFSASRHVRRDAVLHLSGALPCATLPANRDRAILQRSLGILIASVMAQVLCIPPGHAQEADREALKKVAPTLSGQRNGVDLGPDPLDFEDHSGFTSLFNGKSLDHWDGRPGVWTVENGVIVGTSTLDKKSGSTFLVYHGVTPRDFDLKLEIKVENGGGSGIQYRSHTGIPPGRVAHKGEPPLDPRWVMTGPEADFSYPASKEDGAYSGQVYSQNTGRGILAWRGQVVEIVPNKFPRLIGAVGDRTELGSVIHPGWNQYEIIARGGMILHILNGQLMTVLIDDETASSTNAPGLIGLQILGAPCKVSFRDIWLRTLK